MIRLNRETGKITCPVGDTGAFTITLTNESGGELEENISGVGVFAVANKKLSATYLTKVATIVDNTVSIALANEDTRALPVGAHVWDMRIVTDPEFGADGNVICEDATDEVHSLFSMSGMPEFIVTGVAVNV